eukprot:UN02895
MNDITNNNNNKNSTLTQQTSDVITTDYYPVLRNLITGQNLKQFSAYLLQFKINDIQDFYSTIVKYINYNEYALLLHNNNNAIVDWFNTIIFNINKNNNNNNTMAEEEKDKTKTNDTKTTTQQQSQSQLNIKPRDQTWNGMDLLKQEAEQLRNEKYKYNDNLSEEENYKLFLKHTKRQDNKAIGKTNNNNNKNTPMSTQLKPLTEEEKYAIKQQFAIFSSNLYNDDLDNSLENITSGLILGDKDRGIQESDETAIDLEQADPELLKAAAQAKNNGKNNNKDNKDSGRNNNNNNNKDGGKQFNKDNNKGGNYNNKDNKDGGYKNNKDNRDNNNNKDNGNKNKYQNHGDIKNKTNNHYLAVMLI